MLKNTIRALIATAGIVVIAAGCSSSSSSSGGSAITAGHTFTIGLLSDLTGPAASGNKTSVQGVDAGIAWAAKQGYKLNLDTADTTSSPTGVSTAAQKLVLQDNVTAVISVSSLTFLTSSYLTSHNVPVVGVAEDGSEWGPSANMFSTYGPVDATKVATTYGQLFRLLGATNIGSLGYGISPQSKNAAESAALSAQHAGLKVGYLNAQFQFGSTNVGPVALAMKAAGVDGVTASVDPNTGLNLVTALRQAGVNVKAAVLPTGYGGDLTQAGPGAIQAAQDVYFLSTFEPIEMHTSATAAFESNLRKVGVTGDPTYAEYAGYTSIVLLVQGLEAAGSHPTQASLIRGLGSLHHYNAAGLLGSRSIDMSNRTPTPAGANNCFYITKYSATGFALVQGADPICGTNIEGVTTGS